MAPPVPMKSCANAQLPYGRTAFLIKDGNIVWMSALHPLQRVVRRRPNLGGHLPFESQSTSVHRAVPQVQIDKRLVRDAAAFRDALEIRNCRLVQTNRDLLLEALRVWVSPRLRKVVFLPHRFNLAQYSACSALIARR